MSRFRVIPRAETRLTRQAMYDLIRSPLITEKATAVSEHNQIIFKVPLTATKREVKAAVDDDQVALRRGGRIEGFQRHRVRSPSSRRCASLLPA